MVNIKSKISGYFTYKIIRDGKVRLEIGEETKNLVLKNALLTGGSWQYIQVGSGSITPTVDDTSLGNFTASVSKSDIVESDEIIGNIYRKKYTATGYFALGSIVGNLSELGVSVSASTKLHTRSLFKDGLGDPVTLTVTAQDQLVVTYTTYKDIDMSPITGVVDVDGTSVDYTLSPVVSNFNKAGSDANYLGSIYNTSLTTDQYLHVYDSKKITSIDPLLFTYISTNPVNDDYTSSEGVVTLSATGGSIEFTLIVPINEGNYTWDSALFASSSNDSFGWFYVDFNGANQITKLDTQIMTVKITETIDIVDL